MGRATVATPKKDSNGKWGFVFDSAHLNPDGSRRQIRRRGFATRGDAQAELDRLRSEDRPAEHDGLTVAVVLEQFVRTKQLAGKAPATVEHYRWAAEHVKGRWGGWSAEALTAEQLDIAYLDWLDGGRKVDRRGQGTTVTTKPLSARTVEAIHNTLKAAYTLAVEKGQLVRNPAVLATPPVVTEQRHTWWTPEQVGSFLAWVADRDDLPTGMVDLLADTGGRRGEVTRLRWTDLDLEEGTATITRQFAVNPRTREPEDRPTKRPRSKATIGLHPDTVAALKRRRAEQAEDRLKMGAGWPGPGTLAHDLVFTWRDGTLIHPDALTRIIARLSVQAGLPRLTPHGLRHSFATAALKARVPTEVVAARLGNTARVVQATYAHVIPADDHATAKLVGDLYRAAKIGRKDAQ